MNYMSKYVNNARTRVQTCAPKCKEFQWTDSHTLGGNRKAPGTSMISMLGATRTPQNMLDASMWQKHQQTPTEFGAKKNTQDRKTNLWTGTSEHNKYKRKNSRARNDSNSKKAKWPTTAIVHLAACTFLRLTFPVAKLTAKNKNYCFEINALQSNMLSCAKSAKHTGPK